MKDGRTHLAHKAEHAVDLETGAVVGVTVQDADDGDTETSIETLIKAAEQIETVRPDGDGLQEVVGDKGYHSNQSLVDLEAVGVRSYISEPDRGRRNWKKKPDARAAVYRNRRRIRGPRGLRLLRLRGERLEDSPPAGCPQSTSPACLPATNSFERDARQDAPTTNGRSWHDVAGYRARSQLSQTVPMSQQR